MTRFSAAFLFSRNRTRQARQPRSFRAEVFKISPAADAAAFAQRVRKRLGLTQLEFSRRIDVSLDTIRNWEQGKRSPTGAARALLRVLDKAPEACLEALR
jgi:putative transcriptional regulator